MDQSQEILAHLRQLLEKITVLEEKVSKIETHLDAMVPQVDRVNNHITFVNGVYCAMMKKPLEYITSAFYTESSLPDHPEENLLTDGSTYH